MAEPGDFLCRLPVADSKGDWGVGIVRATDVAAVEALRDADPAILSGRGFSPEILPFVRLITSLA
jgi:hypothetical protein